MSSKFGNLEDLFDFLEVKRAEIEKSFKAQMTREAKEAELTLESHMENEDISAQITLEHTEIIEAYEPHEPTQTNRTKHIQTENTEPTEITKPNEHLSQSSTQSSNFVQMAWSTSLETPKTTITRKHTQPLDTDEYDFDIKMIVESSPNGQYGQTDTTLIMEQLCLDEDEFDYDPLCITEETRDNYKIQSQAKSQVNVPSPIDPFDMLSFPLSQFPVDFELDDEDEGPSVVDETFIEDKQFDEIDDLLSEIDLMDSKGVDDSHLDHDPLDLDVLDIPMSQFPATQMMTRSSSSIEVPVPVQEAKEEFVGFSTGRGKKLPPPSDEALKKALKLIELTAEEEEKLSFKEEIKPPSSSFGGFSTGRGKELPPPSKEAMKRARSLMEFDDFEAHRVNENELPNKTCPLVVGFATAKGNKLPPPSKEAMKRARNLMEVNFEEPPTDILQVNTANEKEVHNQACPSVGFATAMGNKLPPPSKAALDRAKQIIGDNDASISSIQGGVVGFSTGTGKAMPPPSEAALKRAKLLEDDIKTEIKPKQLTSIASVQDKKKPFSMSTAWKRTRRPTKLQPPPPPAPKIVKTELVKLFDLNTTGLQRYNLKEFFQQTPNLSIYPSEYEDFGINDLILRINSENASKFKFPCGWGASESHESLLSCGASSVSINLNWTENHFRWIIWKFASLIRTFPDSYSPANLSPSWVLSQLLYRYEREIHQCHRSCLKKIVERDDAAGKYLCLMVAGVDREKKCVELSDGWYSIWTSSLDASLWKLVENSRIREGMKIEISGATLSGQDALPVLEASSRDCPSRLVIWRNSSRLTRWDTRLGFMTNPKQRAVTFLKHLNQIHPQGGPIPALSLVIDRVYPLLFREERLDLPTSGGTGVQTRNVREHYLYLELNPEQARTSKFTPIQRIRVSNNQVTSKNTCNAIISFWNPLGEEQMALLQEGSAAIITNLRASNSTRTQTMLSLVSSKSTRLFRDDLKTTTSLTNLVDSNNFSKLKELKVSESIDLSGGIVLGRSGNYFWIGPSDENSNTEEADCLICLSNFTTSVSLSLGDSVNFRDLTFNHFDNREGVVHFSFTEYSDFKKETRVVGLSFKKSLDRFIELTK